MPTSDATLPDDFKRCFHCGYDLRGVFDDAAGARCPECGGHWMVNELRLHGSNPKAMPRSLPPREPRMSGRWLVILLVLAAVATSLLVSAIFLDSLILFD